MIVFSSSRNGQVEEENFKSLFLLPSEEREVGCPSSLFVTRPGCCQSLAARCCSSSELQSHVWVLGTVTRREEEEELHTLIKAQGPRTLFLLLPLVPKCPEPCFWTDNFLVSQLLQRSGGSF